MKRLVLVLLLLATPASAQTVVWFDGAEVSGPSTQPLITGGVCSGVGNCIVVTSPVKSGNYALQLSTANERIGVTVPGLSATTVFVRFYFQWNSSTGNEAVFSFSNGVSHNMYICFAAATSKLTWGFDNCTAIATGTTVLSANTWYLIEAKGVVSATVGGIELKVNGNTEFTSLGTNTSSLTSIIGAGFGPTFASGVALTEFFDDMMMCTGAYCPAGRAIARQGTAGTPTYDAWTKNSCTGGTINGCWSNTPFTTASNATSATASAAQTMLVSPFNATQSGHGSEVILPHDTINACKTVVVAKMATASSFSIRRRIGGSDTDTAVTLTTSDANYDDGIWTTTTDKLNTAEAGGVHGAGTNTMTVEDAWVTCDYLAAPAPIRHRTILR